MARSAWLAREGEILAGAEVADDRRSRRRGLRGRDRLEGALVLRPCRHVHSFGVRFPIDVAFCASDGTVLSTTTLAPARVTMPSLRARFVVEAPAGSFERWHLVPGDCLEILEVEVEAEAEGEPGGSASP